MCVQYICLKDDSVASLSPKPILACLLVKSSLPETDAAMLGSSTMK